MGEERFRKYLAFRSPELLGGADTRELADDLAREWDGAAYVRVDVADGEVEELRRRNATQEESITHLQSQQRVMKEAMEQALLHLQDCGYKTNKQVQEQLIAAITPKGSEQQGQ